MESKPIKTGLIGFGTGGEFFHAPFIDALSTFELTAVLERSKTKSKERYPNTKVVRTIDELLAIPNLELVVITTPNNTHFELASMALKMGKHVVIDKPFVVTSDEGNQLIELAKAQSRILSVYHNRRFHADFKTVQSLVERKALGEIELVEAHFDRYRPELRPNAWKESLIPGSGILYDLGSHLLDQILVLFGEASALEAVLKIERQGANTVDNFELVLHYPHHKAVLKAGMLVKEPGPVFKLTGTKGTYTKYGLDPQEQLLRDGSIPNKPLWAKEAEENWGVLKLNGIETMVKPLYNDYRTYYENIHQAIRYNRPLEVTAEQANRVIRYIEAAIKSNVENKAVISLR